MLYTMVKNNYTVTWNPGAFGHLLVSIIEIEEFNRNKNELITVGEVHSHTNNGTNIDVEAVHPYDIKSLDISRKIIKPYFKHPDLKFFQWFRNEILFLNSRRHFIEELKQHWNTVEPICDKSYNIDMTELFTNLDAFQNNVASFLEKTELKEDTKEFIQIKRQANFALYNQYLENVVDTVACLNQKQHKDIRHLKNIELAMVLCDYFHLNKEDAMKFCNSYDGKQINSTKDIIAYVRTH